MKYLRLLLPLIVASTFVSLATPLGSPANAIGVWNGTVSRIEDGDTFFVQVDGIGEQRVRIAGLNTNESNASGDCYAAEAKTRLTELIGGRRVELRARSASSTTGGRPLRHVFVDGQNVATTMLREGLAVPLLFQMEPDYASSYQAAWWAAHREGLGLSNPELCGAGPYPNLENDLEMITNGDADESDVSNQNGEWVILRNHGSSAIDFTGWQIKDNATSYYEFPSGTTLGPGAYVRVFTGSGQNSANELYMDFPGPIWSTTDAAYLLDTDGDIRLFDMWPCQALCNDAPVEDLMIDAVQWDVPGPDVANDEWIKVKNVGTTAVDFEDWAVASFPHIVHSGPRILEPGETVTAYGGYGTENGNRMYFGNAGPMLDTAGDIALLIDPNGNVVDCESMGTSDCRYSPSKGRTVDALPDVNGDGWSDLIIGAPGEDIGSIGNAGAVTVRYGTDPGIRTANGNNFGFSNLRSSVLSQSGSYAGAVEAGDLLGTAITFGDFDADGYDDIVAGVPGEDVGSQSNAGQVNVYYGGPQGARYTGNTAFGQFGPIVGGPESNDRFGAAATTGDFDGDGYDDLAVGAPGENGGSGVIHVIYGGMNGLTTERNVSRSQGGAAEAGDAFGSALAAGDFDGDGHDDLAVGVPFEGAGSTPAVGAIAIFEGSPGGLTSTSTAFGQWGETGGTPERDDQFGTSLAVADFDGDGHDDLAVGAPGEAIGSLANAGVVHVLFGSNVGITNSGDQIFYQGAQLPGGPESGDRLGAALSAGDIDQDGFADLVMGAPGEGIGSQSRAGLVQVAYGFESGLSGSGSTSLYQGVLAGGAETGDQLGASVRLVDHDGDGFLDILVGLPGEDIGSLVNSGAISVIYGARSGSNASRSVNYSQSGVMRGYDELGDSWGAAV